MEVVLQLFKTHMDYMERTKFLLGNDKFDIMVNSAPPNAPIFGNKYVSSFFPDYISLFSRDRTKVFLSTWLLGK